jgi:hypothetical protein
MHKFKFLFRFLSAITFGDPYFLTLDLLGYNFGAIGEFWMIKHSLFKLQVRMTLAQNFAGVSVAGVSMIKGVASVVPGCPTVCVLMNDDRTGQYNNYGSPARIKSHDLITTTAIELKSVEKFSSAF